jgi:hypothetical protein
VSCADAPDPLPPNYRFRPVRLDDELGLGGLLGSAHGQQAGSGLRFTPDNRQLPFSAISVYGPGWTDSPNGFAPPPTVGYTTTDITDLSRDFFYDVVTRAVAQSELPGGGDIVGYTDIDRVKRVRIAASEILATTGPTFLTESVAHEAGHLVLMWLEEAFGTTWLHENICAIFGRPTSEWDTGTWETSVKEAACEVWKDVLLGKRDPNADYYAEPGRLFDNRTQVQMSESGFSQWRSVYTGALFQHDRLDSFPLAWDHWGSQGIGDNGSSGDFAGNLTDGYDPDEGGTLFEVPPYQSGGLAALVMYDAGCWIADVAPPREAMAYDAGTVGVYPGSSAPPEPVRTLRWRPKPGQTLTLRADWRRPPDDHSAWDVYHANGIPDWDHWRCAGRMLHLIDPDPDHVPQTHDMVTAAMVCIWQQTFAPSENIHAHGDEWPAVVSPQWETVSDQSFALPKWDDVPLIEHEITVPIFHPDATNVRLRLMIGTHHWDGDGAVAGYDVLLNPTPLVDRVWRGIWMPAFWFWNANQRIGPYWRPGNVDDNEAIDTYGTVSVPILPNNFPFPNFPWEVGTSPFSSSSSMNRGTSWWPVYKPNKDDPDFFHLVGANCNEFTTGLPWLTGIVYESFIVGAEGPTPTPPQLRDCVWPYVDLDTEISRDSSLSVGDLNQALARPRLRVS